MEWLKLLKPYAGRLIWSGIGLITALLFIQIGFFKTFLIIICFLIGYLIGLQADGKIDLRPKVDLIINWLRK